MSQASKDENDISTLLGTSDSDGRTTIPIRANPNTHALSTSAGSDGSDLGPENAPRDENDVPALLCVSSADGVTPVAVYATSDGRLKVML